MRIRAAVTAVTLAASIVVGGAATATAYGHDDDHYSKGGSAHYGGCDISAAVIHGNPLFHGACEHGRFDWR
ncbi:hypothetical protein ABZ128_22290 [Streptomyces sp. NPDC006326]|uniref:hypothetical protein n=1 Tax=Streptomyces sp. NPDC006326 TaxID=3156752 RepID=UPI0033B90294